MRRKGGGRRRRRNRGENFETYKIFNVRVGVLRGLRKAAQGVLVWALRGLRKAAQGAYFIQIRPLSPPDAHAPKAADCASRVPHGLRKAAQGAMHIFFQIRPTFSRRTRA